MAGTYQQVCVTEDDVFAVAAWLRRCASFACSSEPVRVRVCEYVLVSPLLFDAFFCPVQCTPSSIVQVTRLARPGSLRGPGRLGLRVGAGCFVTYRQAGILAFIPWRMSQYPVTVAVATVPFSVSPVHVDTYTFLLASVLSKCKKKKKRRPLLGPY